MQKQHRGQAPGKRGNRQFPAGLVRAGTARAHACTKAASRWVHPCNQSPSPPTKLSRLNQPNMLAVHALGLANRGLAVSCEPGSALGADVNQSAPKPRRASPSLTDPSVWSVAITEKQQQLTACPALCLKRRPAKPSVGSRSDGRRSCGWMCPGAQPRVWMVPMPMLCSVPVPTF